MNPFLAFRIIKLGIKSLLLHKLRSFLNMLGILFGVGSVIAMLGIGEGAKWKAEQLVKRLGPTTIIIKSKKPAEEEQTTSASSRVLEYGLLYMDLERIAETIPSIKIIVPVRKVTREIWIKGRRTDATILGTIPKYTDVAKSDIKLGRWLTQLDFTKKKPVCVLKEDLAKELFPVEYPLGKLIRMGDTVFRVVGVLKSDRTNKGETRSSADIPLSVFVPLSSLRERFGEINVKRSTGSISIEKVEVHEAQIMVDKKENVIPVSEDIENLLKKAHTKNDFDMFVPLKQLLIAEETARIWTMVLGSVAGISLLVGGIGIMNVMLATVTERTREIGIRRALGATKKQIMSQFLVETLVLTLTGGILGIGFGISLPPFVNIFTKVNATTPIYALLLAPGISLIVGLLSGLYPAWKAASMDPVEALRHE